MALSSHFYSFARRLSHGLNQHLLTRLDGLAAVRQPLPLPPPLFIMGIPRSGTTLTYQLVTQQLEVGYLIDAHNLFFGAPNLVTRLVRKQIGRPRPVFDSTYGRTNYRFAPAESGVFWARWFPPDEQLGHYVPPTRISPTAVDSLPHTLASLADLQQKPLVFKSVYLSLAVGALAQLLPEARFIFVSRDLLYNCQSLFLARQKQASDWWSIRPPGYQAWIGEPLWRQVAYQVYATQAILQTELEQYAAGRYYHLQYEALCATPQTILAELTAWLDPLGYQPYATEQIPTAFSVSAKRKVSADVWADWETQILLWQQGGNKPWVY